MVLVVVVPHTLLLLVVAVATLVAAAVAGDRPQITAVLVAAAVALIILVPIQMLPLDSILGTVISSLINCRSDIRALARETTKKWLCISQILSWIDIKRM